MFGRIPCNNARPPSASRSSSVAAPPPPWLPEAAAVTLTVTVAIFDSAPWRYSMVNLFEIYRLDNDADARSATFLGATALLNTEPLGD